MTKRKNTEERLVDSDNSIIESLEWNEDSQQASVRIVGITADVLNKNRRIYPSEVMKASVAELSENMHKTSARSGRRLITGEVDHPSTKNHKSPLLNESVILWESVEWSDEHNGPVLSGETFPNQKGKEFSDVLRFLHEKGMPIPVSQRGYGEVEIQTIDGQKVEVIKSLKITGYDFVIEQSDLFAHVMTVENEEEIMKDNQDVNDGQGDVEETQETRQVPVIDEKITNKIEEMEEALSNKDKALADLARRTGSLEDATEFYKTQLEKLRTEQEMTNWLRSAISGLSEDYPGELKNNLEQLTSDSLESLKEAWDAKIKEYQPIVEKLHEEAMDKTALDELQDKGFDGITEVRNAWEDKIAGLSLNIDESVMAELPKVLHVMDKVNESMGGNAAFNPAVAPKTQSQKLAAEMFQRYVTSHEEQIISGAREWDNLQRRREEARKTGRSFDEAPTLRSAYNLPYLVMAGVVPEVYASLASPEVFTVMPLRNETQRYYVEAWGATPSADITAEVVTAVLGGWANLAHGFVVKSSVVVTNSAANLTYDMFKDYVIDTENGKIWALATGDITNGQSIKVTYTYELLSEGENAPIEFVSTSATHATLVATAKRLGFNLSDEAIKFAASDLGYDTRGSHLQTATYRMAQALDKKMFEMAETHAWAAGMKTSAWSTTPGTGVSNDDNLRALVDRIADAIDLIERYYYTPTHIAMARTLAHKFHSSDLLDQAVQRAGVSLTSDLVAGQLHGLPVYGVPYGQFGTNNILILAGRDTVIKGIYSPLEAVGGEGFINRATTGDVNRLVAARAWYLQEYYDIVVPVDPTDSNLIRRIAVVPVV
jgi:hypothetical protein